MRAGSFWGVGDNRGKQEFGYNLEQRKTSFYNRWFMDWGMGFFLDFYTIV